MCQSSSNGVEQLDDGLWLRDEQIYWSSSSLSSSGCCARETLSRQTQTTEREGGGCSTGTVHL
eukprot:scaffold1900_cov183-Ochromonas_danica.AAC.17